MDLVNSKSPRHVIEKEKKKLKIHWKLYELKKTIIQMEMSLE